VTILVIATAIGMPSSIPSPSARPRFELVSVDVGPADGTAEFEVVGTDAVEFPVASVMRKSSLCTLQVSQSLSSGLKIRMCIGTAFEKPAIVSAVLERVRTVVSVTLAELITRYETECRECVALTQEISKFPRPLIARALSHLECEHGKGTGPL
jgi:hypothetical protein